MHVSSNYQRQTVFNQAQLDLLGMLSHIKSEKTLDELREVVRQFFAQKAEDAIKEMWADGTLNDKKVEGFRNLHERTPYIMLLR